MIYVRLVARKPLQEAQELQQARCYLLLMDLNGMVAHLNWWEKSGSRLPPNASEGRLVGGLGFGVRMRVPCSCVF